LQRPQLQQPGAPPGASLLHGNFFFLLLGGLAPPSEGNSVTQWRLRNTCAVFDCWLTKLLSLSLACPVCNTKPTPQPYYELLAVYHPSHRSITYEVNVGVIIPMSTKGCLENLTPHRCPLRAVISIWRDIKLSGTVGGKGERREGDSNLRSITVSAFLMIKQ